MTLNLTPPCSLRPGPRVPARQQHGQGYAGHRHGHTRHAPRDGTLHEPAGGLLNFLD